MAPAATETVPMWRSAALHRWVRRHQHRGIRAMQQPVTPPDTIIADMHRRRRRVRIIINKRWPHQERLTFHRTVSGSDTGSSRVVWFQCSNRLIPFVHSLAISAFYSAPNSILKIQVLQPFPFVFIGFRIISIVLYYYIHIYCFIIQFLFKKKFLNVIEWIDHKSK